MIDGQEPLVYTAKIAGHPIHPMLVPIPIACFVGALLTDLAYWRTAEMTWSNFSAWLIAVGVVMGWVAAIAGAIALIEPAANTVAYFFHERAWTRWNARDRNVLTLANAP